MHDLTPESQSAPQPAEARALWRFLTADPDDWPRLAPKVTEEVGADTLQRIVRATLTRIGEPGTVTDSPDGLIVSGSRGKVRAWAQVAPGGELGALRIEGARYTPPRRRLRLPAAVTWAAYLTLVTVWNVLTVWTAADRASWLGDMATLAAFYVIVEGCGAPAQQPRLLRRTVEAGALAALASAWRLPELPYGQGALRLAAGLALLAGSLWLVTAARRHRWRTSLSRPLRFPLVGTWYIVQGGGRVLNHHAQVPEQRGALDLVALGTLGTRTRRGRDLGAYAAYGSPVHSPCDGRVTSAADTVQDQKPGEIRYQPPYGNHVFIDTGREIVKLAHLRPGSVTVAKGDTVHAGQLLGEVGNTGNTTEPHLHIHAERDGLGLDLEFTDLPERLYRGRTIRA
ncbi:Peptidase family M23 [Streptomyces sp. 3213]|uniref:M23 family metallopeptidase n=1 Tax=Streptomyces sp. 3213.3 TaxID=1855348 RepID=UPI00089D9A05|nr:M23 family metallopeptidase [Streptomyces sp. 3213.3]SEE07274.1 Peptidase family M23 [Streptomyces sp. 3213] [Streptomyces sp. 3213.3]